jgi:hypothetical protein
LRHIIFDPRFVNEAGNDLKPGKIHTIRQNYLLWKRYEGKETALCIWEGRARQKGSRHKIVCVKRIVSVQEITMKGYFVQNTEKLGFIINGNRIPNILLAERDGFASANDFLYWFYVGNYKPGKMAVIHFTDFRYGEAK